MQGDYALIMDGAKEVEKRVLPGHSVCSHPTMRTAHFMSLVHYSLLNHYNWCKNLLLLILF